MHHGDFGARSDLHHAADIACGDDVGLLGLKRFHLARLQLPRDLGLHQIIGARRSATQVAVFGFYHLETSRFQQGLGVRFDLLPMLQRTGCVIGDTNALRALGQGWRQIELDKDL